MWTRQTPGRICGLWKRKVANSERLVEQSRKLTSLPFCLLNPAPASCFSNPNKVQKTRMLLRQSVEISPPLPGHYSAEEKTKSGEVEKIHNLEFKSKISFLKKIFIDYAITVVPFPPLHSTPSCPPIKSKISDIFTCIVRLQRTKPVIMVILHSI